MIQVDVKQAVDAITKRFPLATEQQRRIALMRALNHTIAKARTQSGREIRGLYKLKVADLAKSLTTGKANQFSLQAEVRASTRTMTVSRFVTNMSGLQGRDPDARVEVEIFKGKQKLLIRGAFLHKKTGLIMARGKYQGSTFQQSKKRYPINPIKTVSPYGAGVNSVVTKALSQRVAQDLPNRMTHELARLII